LTLRADIQPNVKSSTDQLEFESTLPTTKTITFHRADSTPLKITSSRASQAGIQVAHDGTKVTVTFDPKNYRPESGALTVSIWTDCPEEPYIQIPVVFRNSK